MRASIAKKRACVKSLTPHKAFGIVCIDVPTHLEAGMDLSLTLMVVIGILWYICGIVGYFFGAQNMFRENRRYTVFSEFLAGKAMTPWRAFFLSFLGLFLILTNHISWED